MSSRLSHLHTSFGGTTNHRTHEGSGSGTLATGCGTARPTRRLNVWLAGEEIIDECKGEK